MSKLSRFEGLEFCLSREGGRRQGGEGGKEEREDMRTQQDSKNQTGGHELFVIQYTNEELFWKVEHGPWEKEIKFQSLCGRIPCQEYDEAPGIAANSVLFCLVVTWRVLLCK